MKKSIGAGPTAGARAVASSGCAGIAASAANERPDNIDNFTTEKLLMLILPSTRGREPAVGSLKPPAVPPSMGSPHASARRTA